MTGKSYGTVISSIREFADQNPPDANRKASIALLEAVDKTTKGPDSGATFNAKPMPPQKNSVQISLHLVEFDDHLYQANKARIDAAVERGDIAYFVKLEHVSMLSTPSVTTQPGIRANIDVVRELPYPTSFEPAKLAGGGAANVTPMMPLTPREFAIKNVGVSAEITPNINPADSPDPGKIVLGGSVSVVDFKGFTTSNVAGAHLPSFITSESNFIEQMDDDKAKGVWLPSLQEDPEPNLKEGTAPDSPTAALPTKHLLLFVSAARVR